LVEKLLRLVPELKRLRLSSIDSVEADEKLMRAIAEEERLMPHFHLSAQSGDGMILKRMKRRHARADTIAFCETVRRYRPEAAFGADLIAGFPTETEEMFENSLKLVDDAGLSQLHVFPFSPRAGTPAAKMPQLPRSLVKERSQRLRAKGEMARERWLDAMIGSWRTVLIENGGVGHTPCFARVTFDGAVRPGDLVPAMITGRSGDHLTGILQ
jgi:threonylcarbamoyladenosine tRNA methylthiotransferase MtaB